MPRLFGYSRVSTSEQDWSLQVEALVRHGVDERDIYREKVSGAAKDRPELRRVIDLLKRGDHLITWRLDRLARSQLDLLTIAKEIETKNAKLVSLMDAVDTNTATGKLMFGLLGVLGEFERNLLIERTKAGQQIARQRGVAFGRPRKLSAAVVRQVGLAHGDCSVTIPETCRALSISRSSYYNAVKLFNAQNFAGG